MLVSPVPETNMTGQELFPPSIPKSSLWVQRSDLQQPTGGSVANTEIGGCAGVRERYQLRGDAEERVDELALRDSVGKVAIIRAWRDVRIRSFRRFAGFWAEI